MYILNHYQAFIFLSAFFFFLSIRLWQINFNMLNWLVKILSICISLFCYIFQCIFLVVLIPAFLVQYEQVNCDGLKKHPVEIVCFLQIP